MSNGNRLRSSDEREVAPELAPPVVELGQSAVLLGLVQGQPYDGDGSIDQLPVGDNTFSAYGKTYDTGVGSEG